jgi:hypothetical protein
MGTFTHDNQLVFKFIGYNPNVTGDQDPYTYDMEYDITVQPTSVSITTPAFSPAPIINTDNGWLNGTLNDIGADIIEYSVKVTVNLVSDPSSTVTKEFTFILNGDVNSELTWITPQNLGTINNGDISDFSVNAKIGDSADGVEYTLVSSINSIPNGLEILQDGSISGRVNFQLITYGNYTFTVEAYSKDYPALINSQREFTINVQYVAPPETPYDIIYMKGLISLSDRIKVDGLLDYITLNQESKIYRPSDPYFGVASDIRYQHQYGVKSVSDVAPGNQNYLFTEYYFALQRNFYWKNLTLGTLKTAVAKDSNGVIIYEVVYSEIIDNLVNSKGVSISEQVQFTNTIVTEPGPYWTSSTDIYASDTYYDNEPIAKTIEISITSSQTMILNNIEGLTVGMQVVGFPGVTIVNDANGVPPVLLSINSAINEVTLSISQTLSKKQQVFFNLPVFTSSTNSDIDPSLYPNSLDNMRSRITQDLGQVDTVEIIPRWMTSQQSNGGILGFVPCWVICYTKPGMANSVLGVKDPVTGLYPEGTINKHLTDEKLTLNQIAFTVDRIEVDRSLTYTWGETTFDQWPTGGPSAGVANDSRDIFVNFPKKTILR